ncbi:anion permease, partial [Xanthomonas vasicola pv. vasculorum]
NVLPALAMTLHDVGEQIRRYGSMENIPAQSVSNTRNQMYLASESIKHLQSAHVALPDDTERNLTAVKTELDSATRFIPVWVKVVVAIALGLGTMVGWRRIVVTVGERIGKTHLTYAQGASAELVAMVTIGAADAFGLPVSTTHVLSSG